MGNDYWADFYRNKATDISLDYPSQFAAFALIEMGATEVVIEFGCGNGRDSAFFAGYGKTVIAFDSCAEAIALNGEKYREHDRLTFECADVTGSIPSSARFIDVPKVLYARFFLHALTFENVERFLGNCAALMDEQDLLFIEYRTSDDDGRQKETSAHFRLFICPKDIDAILAAKGLRTSYFVEGVGYAKWKSDDAVVARHIIHKA